MNREIAASCKSPPQEEPGKIAGRRERSAVGYSEPLRQNQEKWALGPEAPVGSLPALLTPLSWGTAGPFNISIFISPMFKIREPRLREVKGLGLYVAEPGFLPTAGIPYRPALPKTVVTSHVWPRGTSAVTGLNWDVLYISSTH